MKKKQTDFETADLYLASAISILLKSPPHYKVENNRTLFVYPISDDLYRAMNAYNNGIPLNALEFAQEIKRQRAEMLMRRGRIGVSND